jgi:hypothetical protein
MANVKKSVNKSTVKKYIVMYDDNKGFVEQWAMGSSKEIIDHFNEDPELYINAEEFLTIYELGSAVQFKFVTPQIVFDL